MDEFKRFYRKLHTKPSILAECPIANKGMLVAGMAYNLKKYLKYTQKPVRSEVKVARKAMLYFMEQIRTILSPYPEPIILEY